jgi:hypothetical protein
MGMPGIVYIFAWAFTLLLLTDPVRAFFADWGQRWLHISATAFSLTFSLTPVVGSMARRLGILDRPDARKLHLQATPLLGGVAVFAGFVAALLFNAILSPEVITLLSAAMILLLARSAGRLETSDSADLHGAGHGLWDRTAGPARRLGPLGLARQPGTDRHMDRRHYQCHELF